MATPTDAQLLRDRIVAEIDSTGYGAHEVHVRVGDEIATHAWHPDERRDIHSAAKGVCVLAAGIAAAEGRFDLDVPVATYLPGFMLGEGVDEVTTRHLLRMSSGIDYPWSETMMTDHPDLAREFLSRPTSGRAFQYSNASTYTAMRALETQVGDIAAYVQEQVFTPLGIDDVEWERCPNGFVAAGGGVWLRTEELARVGLLIRDRGVWGGQQLAPAEVIDAMHTDGFERPDRDDGYRLYALSGWGGPGNAWRLHGANGQVVLFAGDAVITFMADDHFGADRLIAWIVAQIEG